jgi:hypothetical protein
MLYIGRSISNDANNSKLLHKPKPESRFVGCQPTVFAAISFNDEPRFHGSDFGTTLAWALLSYLLTYNMYQHDSARDTPHKQAEEQAE